MEKIIQVQEEKLCGLSIDYDEELYPHLMSTIAERMYVLKYFPAMLPFIFVSLFLLMQVVLVDVGG